MATVTFIKYKRQTGGTLRSVAQYVSQAKKTVAQTGHPLASGLNCTPHLAAQEFITTRATHRKDSPVWFYHYVQSFSPEEKITGEQAHRLAKEFAARAWPDNEVLITTHLDAAHFHTHFIVNSVCYGTGRMLRQGPGTLHALRQMSDELCMKYGFSVLPREQGKKRTHGMDGREYRSAAKGESWKFELMRVIDDCMRCAGNREEFLVLLRSEGYDATWTDSRKNITYITPDGRKCRDSKLHMEKYLKENMEAEFGYRTENDNTRNVDAAQKADGRGTTAGTQRDGHGAELERAARNAGQAVPAADAVRHGPENASDESRSAGISDQDANERRKIRETGWEPEREVFFRLQRVDRQCAEIYDNDFDRYEEPTYGYGSGCEEENSPVYMDLDYGSDLVRSAVQLGRAVEQMTDNAPVRDGTTMPPHIDSKRRKKLRQKKTALGHAEDDHVDWTMEQHL